jgi:integrase
MNAPKSGVRPASESSIEIDFRYRGVRCRERLDLQPTPRNLEYARRVRAAILLEIAQGKFDYAKHFPKSTRAERLTKNPGGLQTVEQALRAWLSRKRRELEHTTVFDYERDIDNKLVPVFGSIALRDLTRGAIAQWISEQSSSAKRLNNLLSPLRQMLAEAASDERIAVNPCAELVIRRPRVADKADDIDPFTPEELRKIIDHATGQFRNLVQFAAWTGLRTSELIALRWADVDLKGGVVHVRAAFVRGQRKAPKTAAGERNVVLLKPAADALRDQQEHTLLKHDVVFENPSTGKAWQTDKQIREWNWKPLLKLAGVRYRYPYQLRHTFASTALSAGENVFWVAGQLGHNNPHITARVYARFIPSILPDAGKKAEAVWLWLSGEGRNSRGESNSAGGNRGDSAAAGRP